MSPLEQGLPQGYKGLIVISLETEFIHVTKDRTKDNPSVPGKDTY